MINLHLINIMKFIDLENLELHGIPVSVIYINYVAVTGRKFHCRWLILESVKSLEIFCVLIDQHTCTVF